MVAHCGGLRLPLVNQSPAPLSEHLPVADLQGRLQRAQSAAADAGVDALMVSPGTDLRYLCGYDAKPLERLTCLVVPAHGDPFLVAPFLEEPAARVSPVGQMGLEILTWQETDDPYGLIAQRLGAVSAVALDDHMWAEKVFGFAAAMPQTRQRAAGQLLQGLRMIKTEFEVQALAQAGRAIDAVHAAMAEWLRPGRTEHEVARDITDAIIAAGHQKMDFVIVAAGPNGASPHHEASERVINAGEPVVVDIGGTTPAGYASDCTRMYCIGQPPSDFLDYYPALQAAQAAATAAVRPGVTCEQIDAVARQSLTDAGWGQWFIHRVGHGIGLDTHEHPYMVAGNSQVLEPGMAFSIEPGVYLPNRHGARIEDIVVCGDDGAIVLNNQTRELVVL